MFIYDFWTRGFFFSNQSKWLCAWDIPVHCTVFCSYWSEIMINNFLHHVLHLFYQFTCNSIFFQIENFATIAKNYASLSWSNYGKIIQRKRLKRVYPHYSLQDWWPHSSYIILRLNIWYHFKLYSLYEHSCSIQQVCLIHARSIGKGGHFFPQQTFSLNLYI